MGRGMEEILKDIKSLEEEAEKLNEIEKALVLDVLGLMLNRSMMGLKGEQYLVGGFAVIAHMSSSIIKKLRVLGEHEMAEGFKRRITEIFNRTIEVL